MFYSNRRTGQEAVRKWLVGKRRKRMVVTYFKVHSWSLPKIIEENNEVTRQDSQ
jgi:hypothetical protein